MQGLKLRGRRLFRAAALMCVCLQTTSVAVNGATFTWNGTTSNWNNAANWTGGIPVSDPATVLEFGNGAANYTSTIDIATSPFNVNQLLLTAETGRTNKITATTLTNQLVLTGANPLLRMLGGGTFTFEMNMNMATGGEINVDDAAGTLILGNGSAAGHTFNGSAAGAVITKTGAGTLVFQNTGTALARLNIQAGLVTTNFDGGLFGGATIVDVGSAGTLDFGGFAEGLGVIIGSGTVVGGFGLVFNTNESFSGVMKDRGAVAAIITKEGDGVWTLSGTNTATGQYTSSGGGTTLTGLGGSLAAASYRLWATAFTLDNTAGNNGNRVLDAAGMTFRDASQIALLGSSSSATTETLGALSLGGRMNTITVAPGLGQSAALTVGGFTRTDFSTVLFRGANLGAAPGADVATVYINAPPALVGGGGAAGSRNISIIPWAVGDLSPTGLGNTFVTYDPATGVRPLSLATELAQVFETAAVGDNVRVNFSETVTAKPVNALLLDTSFSGLDLTTYSGGSLRVTSGAVLAVGPGTAHIVGFESVTAGTAELLFSITNPSGVLWIEDPIAGSGGVTKSGPGELQLGAVNTFTGNLRVLGGTLTFASDAALGAATNTLAINTASLRLLGEWSSRRAIAVNSGVGVDALTSVIDTNGSDAYLYGVISGSGGLLQKSGSGTLSLYGTNTYSRPFVIAGGTVAVVDNRGLGGAGTDNTVVLSGGARLRYNAPLTNARAVALQSGGGVIDTAGWNSTMSGVISGASQPLVKDGYGTLALAAVNTFTGGLTILQGAVSIGAANNLPTSTAGTNTLTFNGGTLLTTAALTYTRPVSLAAGGGTLDPGGFASILSGVVSGSGTLSVVGTGTFALTNTGNTANGTADVAGGLTLSGAGRLLNITAFNVRSAGTLFLDNNATAQTNRIGAFPVTLSGDGGLALRGHTATAINEAFGALSLEGGFGNVTITAGGAQSQLTAASLLRNLGTVLFRGANLGNTAGAGAANVVFTAAPALSNPNVTPGTTNLGILPYAVGDLSPAGYGNTLVTYTAGTGVRPLNLTTEYADFASAGAQSNVRLTASATGLTGKTIQSLLIDNGSTAALVTGDGATALDLGGGTILVSGTGAVLLTGFTGINFGTSEGFAFVTNTAAASLEIGAPIQGSAGFTKSGTGTLTLSASNTFTGGLNINAGTVLFADAANLGDPSGAITFGGGVLRPTTVNATLGSRAITLLAGGGTLDTNGFNLTIGPANSISGAGKLTKTGLGTLSLAGSNTYGGGTVVNGGALVIAGDDSLGAASTPLSLTNAILRTTGGVFNDRNITVNNAVFDTNGNDVALYGYITGTGGLVKTGGGSLTIGNPSNSFTGGVTVSAGTLQVGNELTLGAPGTIALGGGAILQLSANLIFSSATRIVTVGTGGATIDTHGYDMYIFGDTSLANGGNIFTKTGSGTLTIESQSGSGLLRVLQGTLKSRSAGSGNFLTGGVFVEFGATLDLNGNGEAFGALTGSGTVQLGAGADLGSSSTAQNTFNGVITGTGDVSFSGSAGSITLGGQSNYVGTTTVGANHTMRLAAENALPVSTRITVNGTLQLNGNNQTVGAVEGTAGSVVIGPSAAVTLTVGQGNVAAATYGGVVSGAGNLQKVGSGSQTFTGVNTFAGSLDVFGGTLAVGSAGSMNNIAGASVMTGAVLNVDGSLGGAATQVLADGVVAGSGTINGTVQIGTLGGISPGNAAAGPAGGVGTLTVAGANDAVTLAGGSTFYFDIFNADGLVPGTDWDFLNAVNGRLIVQATELSPVSIKLGLADGATFNPATAYQWHIAQAAELVFTGDPILSSVLVDDASLFGVGAPYQGQVSGSFYVSSFDNGLYLNYSAVPEPSSLACCGLFGALVWWRHRRRKGDEPVLDEEAGEPSRA